MSEMIDTEVISPILAVIPEQELRQRLGEELKREDRTVLLVNDISELGGLVFSQEPKIILCHQLLLEGKQAQVFSLLRQKFKNSLVLAIGPARPIENQINTLKYGARGYFDEKLSIDRLEDAMTIISRGEVWVERHVISGLIDELSDTPQISPKQQEALNSLSPKEREVAEQVSFGATNKMIARTMNITERTVKAHLTTIFQKMDIADRLSLAIFFRDLR
jgi:DNA-binding NarL/FixJ family response regulator